MACKPEVQLLYQNRRDTNRSSQRKKLLTVQGCRRFIVKCARPCYLCQKHSRPNGKFACLSCYTRRIVIGDDYESTHRYSPSLRSRSGKSDHQEITSSGHKSLFNKFRFLGGRFRVSSFRKVQGI